MALRKVLHSRPDTPFSRPPPLHITVLAIMDQAKVLSWVFDESGEARPAVTKNNKIAIISDGESLTKLTLYEAFGNKLTLNQGFIMRGYSLRGQSPPYAINVNKETQFFKSGPLDVSDELRRQADTLLRPISTPTLLSAKSSGLLLTVEGQVVEVS